MIREFSDSLWDCKGRLFSSANEVKSRPVIEGVAELRQTVTPISCATERM